MPDWVYEEEVFGANYAIWWSPDSSKLAYLRFDETNVDEYSYPVYNPSEDANTVVPYPSYVTMRYPKPGFNNPLVSAHLFDLSGYLESQDEASIPSVAPYTHRLTWDEQRPEKDAIIQEIAWIDNSTLVIKEINRSGDIGHVVLLDTTQPSRPGKVVRRLGKDGEEGDKGWIDAVCL